MTWHVRVRPEAELDLVLAATWYEARRHGLGEEFHDDLGRLLSSLADNALLYAPVFGDVRRTFSRRFPYAVYYCIADDDVVVLSVLHIRRQTPG